MGYRSAWAVERENKINRASRKTSKNKKRGREKKCCHVKGIFDKRARGKKTGIELYMARTENTTSPRRIAGKAH